MTHPPTYFPSNDPIRSCARSAAEMAFPKQSPDTPSTDASHEAAQAEMERIFHSQVNAILDKSILPILTLLACQTQFLHEIFVHSARKCGKDPARFSSIALKSQQSCRLTLEALVSFQVEGKLRESHKMRNELIRNPVYAPMDRPGETTSKSIDPWVAAMEEKLWK